MQKFFSLNANIKYVIALWVVVLMYVISSLFFSNCVMVYELVAQENTLIIMSHTMKTEHETFKACESGNLKEYRIRKRKELGEAIKTGVPIK